MILPETTQTDRGRKYSEILRCTEIWRKNILKARVTLWALIKLWAMYLLYDFPLGSSGSW